MNRYVFPKDQQRFIEGMRQPFVVCQFLDKGVVTIAISDGFCDLFGYTDRERAYSDMNQNMFKDVHPEDTAGFTNAILRFAAEGKRLEVIYRVKTNKGSGYRLIRLTGERLDTDDGTHLAQLWFTDEGDYREESGMDLNRAFSKAFRENSVDNAVRYDHLTGLPNLSYFLSWPKSEERSCLIRARFLRFCIST